MENAFVIISLVLHRIAIACFTAQRNLALVLPKILITCLSTALVM